MIFHGALVYDDKGNVKGEVKGSGRILAGMIKQRNQNIQKKYSIGKPVFLDVPKHQDFSKMKGKFLNKLDVLKAEFMLKDNDTLALYHQKWWDWFIRKEVRDNYNYTIPNKVVEGLVRRWAFFEKKYSVTMMKKDIELRAKEKKLKPSEIEGSTFTVSNLGMFDIYEFTSIINQPNSAILSIGAIISKPSSPL